MMNNFKRQFNRVTGWGGKTLGSVGFMRTHKFKIPNVGGEQYHVQFSAQADRNGNWHVSAQYKCDFNAQGVHLSMKALENARKKYTDDARAIPVTLDTALLILHDLEEAHKAQSGILDREKDAALKVHYMRVIEKMPSEMRTHFFGVFESKAADAVMETPKRPKADPGELRM